MGFLRAAAAAFRLSRSSVHSLCSRSSLVTIVTIDIAGWFCFSHVGVFFAAHGSCVAVVWRMDMGFGVRRGG